jgi:hypothetical protein
MKFIQTGAFDKDFLEKMVDITPRESIHDMLLSRLDYLTGFISEVRPDIIA